MEKQKADSQSSAAADQIFYLVMGIAALGFTIGLLVLLLAERFKA